MNNYMNISVYAIPGINRAHTAEHIEQTVCDVFGIVPERLRMRTRKRPVVEARHTLMYYLSRHTKHTLDQIGEYVGGYDHATVLHAIRNVRNLADTDRTFNAKIRQINEAIS